MEQTWRWFGPEDAVTLPMICQAGATGIVTALHQIPYGIVWSVADIEERKAAIAADTALQLSWSVVESLPIHERIKLGEGDLSELFENYRQSLRNLSSCGIRTVCYNFMPVIDWTRTQLRHPLPGGGSALRFNIHEFAAFDLLMLKREGAERDYSADVIARGRDWFAKSTKADRENLLANIMAGLPGAYDRFDIAGLKVMLQRYEGVNPDGLRKNLVRFLEEIIPTAKECGMRMCIHPDDPPRSLMGLPRVVSSATDIRFILDAVESPANGLTLCSGSLGSSPHNDVPAIAREFASRIHFAHLRNVRKESDGSFMEVSHIDGDTDMVALVDCLMAEQSRRKAAGRSDWRIPMRPDHGHELLDDVGKPTHPGYPAIGRLKGLAELRGVMLTLTQLRGYAS